MENITKALLIAGGILLAIMILSLLAVFGGQMSGYFSQQHKSKIEQQNAEFNAKFENYNGQTIRGNELISVMNKVVNYNTSIAEMEGYDKIIMSVDFKGYQDKADGNFKYYDNDSCIIPTDVLSNDERSDSKLESITNLSTTLMNESGLTDAQLQRLSAEIANIVINESKEDLINTRAKKLKNILGESKANDILGSTPKLTKIVNITKKYYQYTQLKRAMFECKSIGHNTTGNGRVNKIIFEIEVDKNGKAKFD